MKKDWTYKKLGEVAEIVMGQSPAGSSLNETNGVEFHQGKVAFGEKYLEHSGCFTNEPTKLTEGHSLLLCVRAPVGILNITDRKICIGRGLCAITAKEITDTDYLYYALKSKQSYFEKNATGSTFKAISSAIIKDTIIPIPPLAIQRSIVAELDLLHSVISKKKEQLRELDNLAQSLFYQMFGDPITNPMGWEVKKLGEVCTLSQGLAINAGTKHLIVPKSTIPLLRIQDLKSGNREIFIDDKNYPQNCLAQVDDIIYTRTGTLGFVFTGNYGIVHNNCFRIFPNYTVLNKQFFMYYIGSSSFRDMIIGLAQRSSQPDITHSLFKKQTIILPPLSLQQSFAAKVSAIEAQKQAITQSIKETEALLAQRMDRYFS